MIVSDAAERDTVRGPDDWFTGEVWLETICDEPSPSRLRASRVFFTPGARTAWHAHPCGQTLLVTEGIARVQGDGPVREIGPGGSVRIEAGEWHWHGARPDRPMVHLALQDAAEDGSEAVWGEHVTDVEYTS